MPSTNGAKITCACFIYVGVATIGLLLGSLLAGSMDSARRLEARQAQIRDCPNCLKLEKLKEKLKQRAVANASANTRAGFNFVNMQGGREDVRQNLSYTPSDGSSEGEGTDGENVGLDLFDAEFAPTKFPDIGTAQKQIHTRHMSIDIGGRLAAAFRKSGTHTSLSPPPAIDESTPFLGASSRISTTLSLDDNGVTQKSLEMTSLEEEQSFSSSSTSTDSSALNPKKPMTRVKAAKYIFLTLKQALFNSLFIIAIGGVGFFYIEDMTAVDSFYFTTVLLTSVGYGDIVPVTVAGKLFATFFTIIAGTVLLHNMTLISMIPLELRKRRIEHAVLGQFGDQLTDDELRELSTGRLINRLKLATNRPDGLEECTREMFSLAMLVRLGRITEEDVKATFSAFRRLDTGNYGKLNSRTIIEGELMRRKSLKNLAAEAEILSPTSGGGGEWEQQRAAQHYSNGSMSQGPQFTVYPASPNPYAYGAPNPYNMQLPSNGSFRRKPSWESYQSGAISNAGSFNYDEYDRFARSFGHYSSTPSIAENQ